MEYIAKCHGTHWKLYRCAEISGEYIEVEIANFGNDSDAQWKAEKAAQRKNDNRFA